MADYIIDSGKIREMYDKLTDISSRVRFIADMKKYQIARDEKNKPVSEEEKKMIESIEAEFLDRYVTNGTFDTRRKVFETVGLMKAENSYNCYREYEGRLNGFSKNDPLREKKARWQLDQTSAGIENRILNDMTCNIKSCCDKNAGVRKQTYAALNINGNTTMQDLVRKCGVRKEDISAFLKEKGISGDTTVTAYYRQKYPDIRTEQLGDRIEEDVLNTITERWGANVTSDHLASKKLSSGQMKKLKKIASDNALPASFQDINDWVKDYGKRLFREDKDNVLNELESTFIERYTEGKKIFSEDMYRQNEEYRKIYNELSTPEEKLRFVLDLTVYTIGRNVTYGSELKFGGLANELLNDIVDRYITRGTSETSNRVFKCLGGLAAEHLLALRVEDEKLREEFSSEGKLGKKKAANLSKCTMSGDYVFQIRKFLNTCTQALVNSKSTAKAKILSENGIDKDTTLYEYAVKIAVRPEQISQYMKERNAEPDAKMKDVIKAANPGYNDAMALMTLKDEFVNDYSNHIQAEAAQAVLDSAGLDEKKLSHYYEMSENVSGEISTSGIDDWLDKEAPKRMDEIAATAGRFAINAFKRRYDKKTGFERYIRLHTGNDIVASDSEKRVDCLAKAVMASILKKCGSEFDIKRIRSLAETLKKDAAFIKKVKDTEAVTRALTDPDSIEEFKVALYSAPFKTMDGSDEKYIEHMNTLFEGMLPSKGRSDKYKALYDAVRRISELKGAYDESLPADRAARSALIRELNINLYYAAEEYIRDKEKVRTTTNGQKRFSDALDAVSIMASFAPGIKKYAQKTFDRINSKRSAAEGSEKYVSIRKYKVEVRKYEEANVPQERAAEKNAPEIKENPEDKVKPEEKVNQENKIKPEVKENPKEKAGTAANKLPDYLRKTDAALARLKEGKYENDPDHRIFLSDAIYAFVGQMVRATGGAALTDRNTGKPITFKQYMDRTLKDGVINLFKNAKNQTGYVTPTEAYARAMHYGFLIQMAENGARPDKGVKVPEEPALKGDAAFSYMVKCFEKDMGSLAQSIRSTYGEGKEEVQPDKAMEELLQKLGDVLPKDGEVNAQNNAGSAEGKYDRAGYNRLLDELHNAADSYLYANSSPTSAVQAERRRFVISLKNKLADYKREAEAIQNGGTCFVHEPAIAMNTKGDKISYPDIKKNLLAFSFDMADRANEGKSLLFRYDPESFLPELYGEDRRPDKPAKELEDVFTAMKNFRKLFMADKSGQVPTVSFDIIKERALDLYKAVVVCKTSFQGKETDVNIAGGINALEDICNGIFKNIDVLQPYMDIQTPEGRLGDRNIYDVVKTMDVPYRNILLITTEQYIGSPGLPTANQNRTANKAWCDSKEALGKEKNLLQKSVDKARLLRDRIYTTEISSYGEKLYMKPVAKDASKSTRAERKSTMLEIAARDIFLKLTDDANLWMDINKAGKQTEVMSILFGDMDKAALANNPAFLNVHEKATYNDIAEKVMEEAKRLGTLDKLISDLSPKKLIEKLNLQKVKQEEQKKKEKDASKGLV